MGSLPEPMTLDDFLLWEEGQELHYEYDGIDARAMAGGTAAHAFIQAGLLRAFGTPQRGTPCRIVGSEWKVRTEASVRYPDALVTCSRAAPSATIAPDPGVIFEILCKSAARLDLGAKSAEYQSLPSLRVYVVLDRGAVRAQVFGRDEAGEWSYEVVGPHDTLNLPEVGVAAPMAEIYEDAELAD